jgi:hypothetical protein
MSDCKLYCDCNIRNADLLDLDLDLLLVESGAGMLERQTLSSCVCTHSACESSSVYSTRTRGALRFPICRHQWLCNKRMRMIMPQSCVQVDGQCADMGSHQPSPSKTDAFDDAHLDRGAVGFAIPSGFACNNCSMATPTFRFNDLEIPEPAKLPVTFPKPTSIDVNMMPFDLWDLTTRPEHVRQGYEEMICMVRMLVPRKGKEEKATKRCASCTGTSCI